MQPTNTLSHQSPTDVGTNWELFLIQNEESWYSMSISGTPEETYTNHEFYWQESTTCP